MFFLIILLNTFILPLCGMTDYDDEETYQSLLKLPSESKEKLFIKMHSVGSFWRPEYHENNKIKIKLAEEVESEKEDKLKYLIVSDLFDESKYMSEGDFALFMKLIKNAKKDLRENFKQYTFLSDDLQEREKQIEGYGCRSNSIIEELICKRVYKKIESPLGEKDNQVTFEQRRIIGNNQDYFNDNVMCTITEEGMPVGLLRFVYYIKRKEEIKVDESNRGFVFIGLLFLCPEFRKKNYTEEIFKLLEKSIRRKFSGEKTKIEHIEFTTKHKLVIDKVKEYIIKYHNKAELTFSEDKNSNIYKCKLLLPHDFYEKEI